MLWYKAWLETRWRFLIGLALLTIAAAGTVFDYPAVQRLLPAVRPTDLNEGGGVMERLIKQAVELQRDFRGFVWFQWFRQNLPQLGTLFAVLLGSGAGLSGGLFTLSLPASRHRLLGTRAATGLAELLVLAVIPSLAIPILSPAIGQTYRVSDAIVHGACLFLAAAVFFSLALLLSTVFSDMWRPLLIVCAVAVVLAVCESVVGGLSRFSLFRVMSAERYFRSGDLPWFGLLASGALSAAMLYGAAVNIARRDF